MVRQAERVVDDQVHTFERADAKSERLLGLAVAAMGAGLAVATTGIGRLGFPVDPVFSAMLLVGAICALGALWQFLGSSLGLLRRSDVQVGLSPDWIARRAAPDGMPVAEFQAHVLRSLALCFLGNLAKLEESLRHRREGIRLLLAAFALFAAAILYISGR